MIEPGRRMPLPVQLVLVAAIALLGAGVLLASTGALGRLVADLGGSISGALSGVKPAPTPVPSLIPLLDAPALISSQPYTNQPTVDLGGTLPSEVAGRADYRVRIYRSLGTAGAAPMLVREQVVGTTPEFTVSAVILEKGIDFFIATLVGPGGETRPSAAVRVVYYASPPVIVMSSPTDGQTINASTVTLNGRTRAGTALVARDEATGASATGTAGPDDQFAITLALAPGTNGITLSATDLAGNTSSAVISVLGGTGRLSATLTASDIQFSAAALPQPLTLTATVTDPDGHPVAGAPVTFTLSLPGVAPITQDGTTDGAGTAIFATTLARGASPGNGLATVLVKTSSFGSVTARAVFVISK
jgi:Bacterial Ig-like domain (group 1)/Glucodextranase, domain B